MHKKIVALVLTMAGSVAALAYRSAATSDLDRYLLERRQAGMSEGAESALRHIADVEAGRLVLTFEKDPRYGYTSTYTTAFCPRPGADRKQLAKLEERSRNASRAQLQILKEIADADGSGFVSTREGTAVAQLVDFAWEATFLAEHERRGVQQVARSMEMPMNVFSQKLRAYRDLLRRSAGKDPKLRDIPL